MLKKEALAYIKQLKTQTYPWLSNKKLKEIESLLLQTANDQLDDRSSGLHLTASAFVFLENAACFIDHPYLNRRLLPAGHVEKGEQLIQTAKREFEEETGFKTLSKAPVFLLDVNYHSIPANPIKNEGDHHHIDFRFNLCMDTNRFRQGELGLHLLRQEEAPEEFQPYFLLQDLNQAQLILASESHL